MAPPMAKSLIRRCTGCQTTLVHIETHCMSRAMDKEQLWSECHKNNDDGYVGIFRAHTQNKEQRSN